MKVHRHRYVIFETLGARPSGVAAYRAIRSGVLRLFGEEGLGRMNLRLTTFDEIKCRGILSCDHDQLWKLRVSMALITEVGGSKAHFRVIKVTGLRRKAERIMSSAPRITER